MGSKEDNNYWDAKYAEEPEECEFGEHNLAWDDDYALFICLNCDYDEEYDDSQEANEEAYKYG